MLDVLNLIAKYTKAIKRAIALTNLFIGRQAPSGQLANKDSYLQGIVNFPDVLGMSYRSTLDHSQIKRLG
jgi:hypothetical protein